MEKNKKKDKKKSSLLVILGSIFMMLVGFFCGFFMMDYIEKSGNLKRFGFIYVIISLAFFYVVAFIQIVIHEAGHLVCGLISGYGFSSFRIGSLMWLKENGKIKFKRFSLVGTGGQCLMTPPELVDGKMPYVLYNLGGSFANLITGLLCLGLYFIAKDIPFLSDFLLINVFIGGALALMNGTPIKSGMVTNDGYNAFSLGKNKAAIKALWLQLKINEQVSKGVRLKNMSDNWFVPPADEEMKNNLVAAIGVFNCNRLMDAHKFEEADKLMEHYLSIDSEIIDLHRNLLICDRIFCELIAENRDDVIEELHDKYYKKFVKAMKNFPSVIRTEYAYSILYKKDKEKAKKIMEKFEKTAKTYPYASEIEAERELIAIC